jgi:tRNA A-37 threonylcarbamoyl transferase component Bud32
MTEAKNRPSSAGTPGSAGLPGSGSRTITGPRLATATDPTVPGSVPAATPVPDGGTRLRIVTIAPGTQSFPDIEAPSRDKRDPYVGSVIDGRYRVETVLGEGGMGVVYRCSHTIIGKKLALKVLRADLARDQEVTERFLNEAKSASGIGNPHIVDISDFGQFPDGATYFVMEYLNGVPLGTAISGGQPLPVPRLLKIGRQLAEGLAAAHAAGIVHRDLKPDNIFLIERGADKDFVKILDFGIAKVSTAEGKLTRAGAVFGTPHYMSPEQAAGTSVDQRGDIYSLGIIMYELAAAKVPFDADNFMGVLTQHMYKAPTPLREAAPQPEEVTVGLEAVVMKCLAKRPENRYQSMDEVIVDIDRLIAGAAPQAARDRGGAYAAPAAYYDETLPSTTGPRRSRTIVTIVVALLALVAIAGAVLKMQSPATNALPETEAKPEQRAPEGVTVAPTAIPVVPLRQVMVAAEPLDAQIWKDGKNLGQGPLSVEVPEGKNIELQIIREGYKNARVVLDGSEGPQSIKLERVAAPVRPGKPPKTQPTAAPKPTATKKRPSLGGGEIIDPWSK